MPNKKAAGQYRSQSQSKSLYGARNNGSLGHAPTYRNGKFYNTAFGKPIEISKARVKKLHQRYDPAWVLTDREVVEMFVMDCRRNFVPYFKNNKDKKI